MWLAVTVMVSVNLARSSATSAVMILVVLAMRMHRPASFSNNISPLSASIRIAAAADNCTASARQGSSASSIVRVSSAPHSFFHMVSPRIPSYAGAVCP